MTDNIRVLIVDDHTIVRDGIKYIFQTLDNIELVGEAENGETALTLCADLQPDVVLMDLKMAGMGGIAATEAIRRAHPNIQVIALTSFHDKEMIEAAMQAGAIGYLLKNVSGQALEQAIHAACRGEATFDPQVTQTLLAAPSPETLIPQVTLTPRQQEVLQLMVAGLNNTEIARRLHITRHTARFHVSAVLEALGATSRSEAVAIAVKHGLVDA